MCGWLWPSVVDFGHSVFRFDLFGPAETVQHDVVQLLEAIGDWGWQAPAAHSRPANGSTCRRVSRRGWRRWKAARSPARATSSPPSGPGASSTSTSASPTWSTTSPSRRTGRSSPGASTQVSGTDQDFALARFDPDGDLDTAFGSGGRAAHGLRHGLGGRDPALASSPTARSSPPAPSAARPTSAWPATTPTGHRTPRSARGGPAG